MADAEESINDNREEIVGGLSCEEDESVGNVNDTQNDETVKTFKDLVSWILKLGLVLPSTHALL